ncbi:glycosyltransferase [Actinokineospora sp. PR83]|uniref:glycosyltransferase n=1 Tax=Actinokineospora sp. PR83 TaxID=2884908 RepID=UPI001F175C37|nr:glycosyltransferase [Actinokineospora sp. PR83]MCG8917587.1 glycosyltransferase [Actinokineospora sp. PR83]
MTEQSGALLAVLRATGDVSAGSPELAAGVRSLEAAAHFSPARLGVLDPLRLRAGARALHLGCGSGAFLRALAEAGLVVTGYEPDAGMAAVARERCRDLTGVVVGGAEVLDGTWDLVLADGPDERVVDLLAPGGLAVLVFGNELGLAHVLGAPARPGAWSRSAVVESLAAAGLTARRTLMAYPDETLPRVLLDESAFDRPDAAELVDKLVRDPVRGSAAAVDPLVPARYPHRLAVANGSGAAVAPGYVVFAARDAKALARGVEEGLAWLPANPRLPLWRRTRRLDGDLTLRTLRGEGGVAGWLRQHVVAAEPLVPGRGMDALVLDALRAGDLDQARTLLVAWREHCAGGAEDLTDAHPRHPFLPGRAGVPVLPADRLDVHPGNLIVGADGVLTLVDDEWRAGAGVDAELVLLRALVEFAREIVGTAAEHPWRSARTVHEVLTGLCDLVGLTGARDRRWDELLAAEASLQEAVYGRDASGIAEELAASAHAVPPEPLWRIPGGLAELRADRERRYRADLAVAAAQGVIEDRERDLARVRAEQAELADRLALTEHALASANAALDTMDDRLALAFEEVAGAVAEAGTAWESAAEAARAAERAEHTAASLSDRLTRTALRLAALENSKLVRRAHRTLWPAARVARGVRDLALGRPGEESDGVLRRIGAKSPAVSAGLATRYRRAAAGVRESGLHFDVPVPAEPVPVGRGQVVELTGWVVHAAVGVRAVRFTADGAEVTAEYGLSRPDVSAALHAAGVRAPEGSGVHARLAVRTAVEREVPLSMAVELTDGTVLHRDLPPLPVRPGSSRERLVGHWAGTGPKVAVCLALYEPDIKFLAAQLDSIRAQQHTNWFCVLCDDGSTEDTLAEVRALVADDPRFALVVNEDNVGFYANFGRAAELAPADADAIAPCDQDDVWHEDKLSSLLAPMADPEVQLVYADMRLIDEHDNHLADSFWLNRVNHQDDLESLLLLNTVTGASALIRADLVFDRALPMPPGTPSAFHDHWFAATALVNGRIEFIDRPLHSYRQHSTNVTGRQDERLDKDLPSGLALVKLANGADIDPALAAELEAVAEFELRRVAQYARVLLLRNEDTADEATKAVLRRLSAADQSVRALLPTVAKASRDGGRVTAGAERRMLAAALRRRALRAARLRIPPLTPPS